MCYGLAVDRPLPTRITLRLGLDDADDDAALREAAAKKLGVPTSDLPPLTLAKRAIDARGREVRFELVLDIGADTSSSLGGARPQPLNGEAKVIIVGDGPAGLFCAYELARRGVRSIVLERGKQVQPRRRDLAQLNRGNDVPTESNYCFGEGGAGTYSDGKLYTRANKRGNVRDVLEILTLHGAPARILTDARPHIGSNLLPKVVTALRERLEECGVEFHFDTKVTGLLADDGQMQGVVTEDGTEFLARHVVLATGHSGRDVWRMLQEVGAPMTPKAFALGVRIEHPQTLINEVQYGRSAGHPKLPAAYYSVKAQVSGERAVFSFCMCPGGFIVPAATERESVVVNGMSLTKRASPFANSGLVVSVSPEQWEAAGFSGVFGGVDLQRTLEEAAFRHGGGASVAPATRVTDFLAGKSSSTLPKTSYQPGLCATDIAPVLDSAGLPLAEALREGLGQLNKKVRGYISEEAVLVGVETRTSAPLRIERDEELQSPGLSGLYPAGEGAGFAGGIISAALDGIRIANVIA